MKIYDWHIAPNPRRVHIFLAEKGIDVPLVEVGDGFLLKPEYREKFPQAMVPMLELDDGTVIGEAMAICRYFESIHPNPYLFGTDPISVDQITSWENRANEEGFLAAGEIFRNTHPDFADRSLPGFAAQLPQIPQLVERGKIRLAQFYKKIDSQFAKHEFLAGNTYSAADITCLCAVDFAGLTENGIESELAENYPNLKRWYKEVSSRPSAEA